MLSPPQAFLSEQEGVEAGWLVETPWEFEIVLLFIQTTFCKKKVTFDSDLIIVVQLNYVNTWHL